MLPENGNLEDLPRDEVGVLESRRVAVMQRNDLVAGAKRRLLERSADQSETNDRDLHAATSRTRLSP